MRRRLFTFCSALSLLLCLATCGMWVRSYGRDDSIERGFGDKSWRVSSHSGSVTIQSSEVLDLDAPRREMIMWHCAGFGRIRNNWVLSSTATSTILADSTTVPDWFLTAVTAIAPALSFRAAIRRRHRRSAGECRSCGYDLCATPDRCPECGRSVHPPTIQHPAPVPPDRMAQFFPMVFPNQT